MRLATMRTRLAVLLAAVVITGGVAGASAASASGVEPGPGQRSAAAQPAAAPGAGLTLDNLQDVIVTIHYTGSGTGPELGAVTTYHDNLIDESGHQVGTVDGIGKIIYRRPQDNHWLAYYQEHINLAGGTLYTYGLLDISEVFAGQWQSLHAVGTGGRYLGETGVRSIQMVQEFRLFNAGIVLFGR